MRLVTFRHRHQVRIGRLDDAAITDLAVLWERTACRDWSCVFHETSPGT